MKHQIRAFWLILGGCAALAGWPLMSAAQDDYPTFELGGRLQLDYTFYDEDVAPLDDGGEDRRARLEVSGGLAPEWDYKLQLDFSPEDPEVKDGFLRYSGIDSSRIWLGSFKQPFSLEEWTSSKYITFIERALPNILAPSRRLGVGFQHWGERYMVFGAVHGDEVNSNEEGSGANARLVFTPISNEQAVFHLGLGLGWEEYDGDSVRLRQRPEAHQDSTRLVDTGTLTGVDDLTRWGLEAAYARDRFSAQAEYLGVEVNRTGAEDLSFDGYYLYLSYFLTNDSRPYKAKDAAFDRVKPGSSRGAWELAARFSNLDLSDADVLGGEEDNFSIGVNYYATSHLRFSANYIAVDTDAAAGDDDPNILVFRAQFDF